MIKREATSIVQEELKDPRLGFLSITQVKMSPDLRYAKIFVSIMGTQEEKRQTIEALTGAAGFIRNHLGKRVRMRYIPELSFAHDESLEQAASMYRLIEQVRKQDESLHKEEGFSDA